MAQEEKDSKKSNSAKTSKAVTSKAKSSSAKSASKSAEKNPPENAEVEKVVEDAKKSLIDVEEAESKSTKSSKSKIDKELTAYQEQALQGVTKSRKNKKTLIIILVLLVVAALVGGGIALFLMLKPEEEPVKAVVCKVEVISYRVEKEIEPEKYIVIGESDEFNFNEGSESTTSYTKDLISSVNEVRDVALVYLVNNVTENNYIYTLDFSGMIIENCNVVVKINDGETYAINSSRRIITISQAGDVVLEVRISVKDNTIPDVVENTRCEGGIDLTLSIN